MTDQAERWRNVAQAAQWLAEGRRIQARVRDCVNAAWLDVDLTNGALPLVLYANDEYRLKPEPPKPGTVHVIETRRSYDAPWVRCFTLIDVSERDLDIRVAQSLSWTGHNGSTNTANLRVRKFVEQEMP